MSLVLSGVMIAGVPPSMRRTVIEMRLPAPEKPCEPPPYSRTEKFVPLHREPNWHGTISEWRADVAAVLHGYRYKTHHQLVAALMAIRDVPNLGDAAAVIAREAEHPYEIVEFVEKHIDEKLRAKAKKKAKQILQRRKK